MASLGSCGANITCWFQIQIFGLQFLTSRLTSLLASGSGEITRIERDIKIDRRTKPIVLNDKFVVIFCGKVTVSLWLMV